MFYDVLICLSIRLKKIQEKKKIKKDKAEKEKAAKGLNRSGMKYCIYLQYCKELGEGGKVLIYPCLEVKLSQRRPFSVLLVSLLCNLGVSILVPVSSGLIEVLSTVAMIPL